MTLRGGQLSNSDIVNTLVSKYIGGNATFTSSATTVISTANVAVKLNGTTLYKDLSSFRGDNDNEFVYIGEAPVKVRCEAHLNLSGGGSDTITAFFRHWVDSSSSYVDLDAGKVTGRGSLGVRSESTTLLDFITMSPNDRLEVWVSNTRDTTNISVVTGGKIAISRLI